MEQVLNNVENTVQNEQIISTPDVQNLQQEAQVEHKQTPQESFQELRMRAEQAERERNEAVGYIKQIEQYALQQQQQQQYQQQQQAQPVEPNISYEDDDIIEGRHLKAEFSSIKKELNEFKRQAEESRKIAEVSTIENRLRSKYNDFDSVVTIENIQKLRELKPEIAATLHQTQDMYSKAAATYTLLKDLGISRSNTAYQDDQIRAQSNLNKPKVSPSLGSQNSTTPLVHASSFASGNLTEERKNQIYQQMLENAKRR